LLFAYGKAGTVLFHIYGISGISPPPEHSLAMSFIVSGNTGVTLFFVLSGFLAFGTCRGAPWAWWTAAAASIAAAVSSVATFAFANPGVVLEAIALPPEQLMVMQYLWPREPWIQILLWLSIWGSLLAYLFVVKPLFNPPLGRGRPVAKS